MKEPGATEGDPPNPLAVITPLTVGIAAPAAPWIKARHAMITLPRRKSDTAVSFAGGIRRLIPRESSMRNVGSAIISSFAAREFPRPLLRT
jgi:hypothetical protein